MRRLALLPILLLAAACAAPAGGTAQPSQGPSASPPSANPTAQPTNDPSAAGRIVARLEYIGGFTPPEFQLMRTPSVVIYGDGTVITPGVTTTQYPGPLVMPLMQQTLTPDGLAAVKKAIDASGLTSAMSYPANGVADAPDTQLELHTGSVDATATQGMASEGNVTDPAEKAARRAFDALVTQLGDLTKLVGDGNISAAVPFEPKGVRLFLAASDGAPAVDQSQPKPLAWRLKTPLASFGAPYTAFGETTTCGTVTGADLEALWPVLWAAHQIDYFTHDGKFYTPTVRPLLPGEAVACPA
jgi:hypothetical protein